MTQLYKTNFNTTENSLLTQFCDNLTYPIYYLSMNAVRTPLKEAFSYTPYQYSLHIEYSNGFVEHKEFIATNSMELVDRFVESLCKDIPFNSTVITNHLHCDKSLLEQLSQQFTSMSYHLLSIKENLKDLSVPFKENWNNLLQLNDDLLFFDIEQIISDSNCCNKEFELGLEKDYVSLLNENQEKCHSISPTLLQYSKIDTLLMVEILKKLRHLQ